MKQLNWKRVLLGGLAAGLLMSAVDGVVNMALLQSQFDAHLERLSATAAKPIVGAFWIGVDFVYALAVAFLGAALRPMFGPGFKPYATAAIVVWLLGYLSAAGEIPLGVLPASFHLTGALFALIGFSFGAFVASKLYREPPVAFAPN